MFRSAIVGIASAQFMSGLPFEEGDSEFIRFIAKYGKNYSSRMEFEMRRQIFQEKLAVISAHNVKNGETHTLDINMFADYTDMEWAAMRGYKPVKTNAERVSFAGVALDDSKDWYADGLVNPVKDQGGCGSCWAFSAVGAVESANAIKTGTLQRYSEQQVVDCDVGGLNHGCQGGFEVPAFEYMEKNPLMLEEDYPYDGYDLDCRYDASKAFGNVSSYVEVVPDSQVELQSALMNGPVSVGVDGTDDVFQFYRSGILTSELCGTDLNHGVLAVGYGTENGIDYYLVKNSWSEYWGDKGFVKIGAEKNGHGVCGIQIGASQPSA